MKQLPDILTSATFWAAVGTLWAAAGAWFTYLSSEVTARKETYKDILNLIAGLEAEFELVAEWAKGGEGKKARVQLVKEHPDWFNPSLRMFPFSTPVLSNFTNSPHTKSLGPLVRPMVLLSHSIRRLLDSIGDYNAFVMGDVALYQSVLGKFAINPNNPGFAPTQVVTPLPHTIKWTAQEHVYINHIFMKNAAIHQDIIGNADSTDSLCLFNAFRVAREDLGKFKGSFRQEPLPRWFWTLHLIAGWLALNGLWQVLRWFRLL